MDLEKCPVHLLSFLYARLVKKVLTTNIKKLKGWFKGEWSLTFLGESELEFLDDESVNMFDMATNVDTR